MEKVLAQYLEWIRSGVSLGPNRLLGPYAPFGVQIDQTTYAFVGFVRTLTYPASSN